MSGVKGIIRSVKNVALQYSDIEIKVREATSNDKWGASSSQMAEIARTTNDYESYPLLFAMLWKRLNDQEHYLHVQKALLLVDYLLRNGSERFVTDAKRRKNDLLRLQEYRSYNADGEDVAKNCRNKAAQLYAILDSDGRIREERTKADRIRDVKYSGSGPGGYVEQPSSANRWQCPRCTFLNPWERQQCEMCDTEKPHGAQAVHPSSREPHAHKKQPEQEREESPERKTEAPKEPKEPKEHRHKEKGEKKKKKKHRKPEEGAAAGAADLFSEPSEPFAEPPTDPFSGKPTDPFASNDQFDVLASSSSASAQYQNVATRGKAESIDFLSGGFQAQPTSYGGGMNMGGAQRQTDWTQDFVVGVSATSPAHPSAAGGQQAQPTANAQTQPAKKTQVPDDDIWGMVMGSLDNIVASKEPEKRHIQTTGAMNQRAPLPATAATSAPPAAGPYAGYPPGTVVMPGPYGPPGVYPGQYPPQMYGQPQHFGQPMGPYGQPLVQPFGPGFGQAPPAQQSAANTAFSGLAWN